MPNRNPRTDHGKRQQRKWGVGTVFWLRPDKKKAAIKIAAVSFGWDTSKLQKITLFQAHRSEPLHRTTVRCYICRYRASFLNFKIPQVCAV